MEYITLQPKVDYFDKGEEQEEDCKLDTQYDFTAYD